MTTDTAASSNTFIPSDEQADFFVQQGYLIVENLISADEIAELKADLLKLARGGYPCNNLEPLPTDISDDEALQRILCIHQPHFVSAVIKSYTTHPAIAAVLGRIVGAHLRDGLWDGAVKCMQSMYFAKPPGKPGQAWHQDEIYIPTRDRSLCGAWIAVDDATIDNGCLWVLPGSHRPGVLYQQRDHDKPGQFDFAQESYGFDDGSEIPVEVPAGSVVFFNGHLLHRSKKNVSDHYRRALVNHYMTAQSFLPWGADQKIRDGEVRNVARLDNRKVHMVCGEDPHAAFGYEESPNEVYLRRDRRD